MSATLGAAPSRYEVDAGWAKLPDDTLYRTDDRDHTLRKLVRVPGEAFSTGSG